VASDKIDEAIAAVRADEQPRAQAPGAPPAPSPRLRLLKVAVQATYVLDDGTSLKELPAQPTMVPASDWPAFAARDPLAWVDESQIPGVAR
jgi:hypothetical protein